jgi:hypothetical protein
VDRHAGGLCGEGKPVVGGRRDDADDLARILAQRVEHGRSEVAGTHQRALHEASPFAPIMAAAVVGFARPRL